MAGGAMWVILAFSIIVLGVALDRAIAHWAYLKKAQALHDTVLRCLQRGAVEEARSACERSRSPLADVFLAGFERRGRIKFDHLGAAVHRERVRVLSDLKSRTWMLGTIGATAPFVGLFGTVVGIIEGLGSIFEQKKNDLAIVAGPLSEALYATAAGILVAVEAVLVFNYFNQRLSKVAQEMRLLTEEFLEILEEYEDQPESQKASKSKKSSKTKERVSRKQDTAKDKASQGEDEQEDDEQEAEQD